MKDKRIIRADMTLDEITNGHRETIDVFNRFGMDMCCGGGATLAEAAERDGVRLAELEEALDAALAGSGRSR